MAVMGSSLGGFYATHVAETCGCKAVLLNPAVNPARDLAKYIGEQTAWHDPNERFFFEPRFVDELRALAHGAVARPENYFAVIAKGDEVLDWREMTGRYPGAQHPAARRRRPRHQRLRTPPAGSDGLPGTRLRPARGRLITLASTAART